MNYNDQLSLKEGIKVFQQQYREDLQADEDLLPVEVRDFFRSHDAAHVIFGCDISLYGEGCLKLWTIFGTTLGFIKHLRLYRKARAYELAKKFNRQNSIADLGRLLRSVPSIILRARRMHKPWPWDRFDDQLDRSIEEIRREYNIQVL